MIKFNIPAHEMEYLNVLNGAKVCTLPLVHRIMAHDPDYPTHDRDTTKQDQEFLDISEAIGLSDFDSKTKDILSKALIDKSSRSAMIDEFGLVSNILASFIVGRNFDRVGYLNKLSSLAELNDSNYRDTINQCYGILKEIVLESVEALEDREMINHIYTVHSRSQECSDTKLPLREIRYSSIDRLERLMTDVFGQVGDNFSFPQGECDDFTVTCHKYNANKGRIGLTTSLGEMSVSFYIELDL